MTYKSIGFGFSLCKFHISKFIPSTRFIVVANEDESIKLNILEAAEGKRKSQVHEFLGKTKCSS